MELLENPACILEDYKGRVPPSCILTFFIVSDASFVSILPTALDPMKLILRTSGFVF
jgi:hypothetical protein